MIKLKKELTEPEYRLLPELSYSKLSGLIYNPVSLKYGDIKMTDALIHGSAVDTWVFDGKDVFDSKFKLMSVDKPAWNQIKLYEAIYSEIENNLGIDEEISSDLNDYNDLILRVSRLNNYGDGWHDPTVIRKVKENYQDYHKQNVESKNLIPLSNDQYENIKNNVNALKESEFTKQYFNGSTEDWDIYYQFPIIWEYFDKVLNMTIHCKSLLDILIIDNKNKKIYPIDLKTTGKEVEKFPDSFIYWNYYIQSSFYTDAVKYLKNQYPELFDYSIEMFKFIVISSKDYTTKPLIFKTNYIDYKVGKFGGKVRNTNEKIRGYIELVRDMNWHIENDKYQYSRDIYENNGQLELNILCE